MNPALRSCPRLLADRPTATPALMQGVMHCVAAGVALSLSVRALDAQIPHARRDAGSATWDSAGFVVRFPRSVSPDSVTVEMTVGDNFSGYEWRVALIGDGDETLLTAFVIAPDDTLALHRYRSIAEAWQAGALRRCEREASVLACARPARGFVRDAGGRLEIGIRDANWLRFALRARTPRLLLMVKRDRQELWSEELPLTLPDSATR